MNRLSKDALGARSDPSQGVLGILAASVLVAAVSVLVYLPTLRSNFHAEGFGGVYQLWDETFTHWLTTLFDDYTQGMWGFRSPSIRPIEALAWMIDLRLWGVDTLGWHLTNLFLHALSSVLVLWIVWRLTPAGLATGTVAGALFAVHATHAEAVSWIAGRTDMIPTALALLTLLAFGSFRAHGRPRALILSLCFFTLCLLSKEIAIIVPFLVLGYDLLLVRVSGGHCENLKRYRVHAAYLLLLLGYLALRWVVFGAPLSNWSNPGGGIHLNMFTTFLLDQVRIVNLLVLPVNVLEVRIHEGVLFILSLALLAWAVVAMWSHRHRAAIAEIRNACIFFGPIWYVFTIAPLFYAPTYSRYLYLPSVGLCIAVPLLLGRLLSRKGATASALIGLALMGAVLVRENIRWREAMALTSSVQREVFRLAAEIPENDKIIVDIPGYYQGIKLLQYSFPFAVEPPFGPAGLSERVLEKPEMYYHEWRWPEERKALIAAMRVRPENNHVIRVDHQGRVYSHRLASAELDGLLRRFYAGGRGGGQPPPVQPD